MSDRKNKVRVTVIAILTLICIVIYGTFDPMSNPFPRCPFFVLTGLECPGCGSQRAFHELLNLNFSKAFSYNAFMCILIPLGIIYFGLKLSEERYPSVKRFLSSSILRWGILISILLWWIIRNILN